MRASDIVDEKRNKIDACELTKKSVQPVSIIRIDYNVTIIKVV